MKNLFLSVVLLLTVSFAFAANDVETVSIFDVEKTVELNNTVDFTAFDLTSENYSITKVVGTCYITLSFYGEDGEHLATHTLAFEGVANEQECSDLADRFAALL